MTLALLTLALLALLGFVMAKAFPHPLTILVGGIAGLIFGVSTWAGMPTLAPNFYTLPTLLLVIGALGVANFALARMTETDRAGTLGPALGVGAVGLVWILGLWIGSWGMLRSDTYRGLIEVAEKKLDSSVEIIDQTHARLVDESLAERRALELLGVEKGLGSSYSIGTPTVQMVAGKQVWVAPLEPARFWVWLTEPASPGYVVVSATNYSDARIVLDHPLHYTKNSWFWGNVERRAWNHAPATAQTDASFEIDDAGKPHWVITTYTNEAGGSGPKVTGTLILDASTGAISDHAVDKQPEWVDRIQPEWLVAEQLELWGDYVHGYWNWGLVDVVHPTQGMSLVNLQNGRSAWFTGIVNARSQSQNSAATNGFASIDTRTGKATIYYQQGVSEAAAGAALEGAVQEKRYKSTHPIAYLVHGSLTYVATLKDFAGNPRLVGMVSALDRSVVATGQSLDDVTRAYAARLRTASDRVTTLGAEAAPEAVTGRLVRSGAYVLDGRSYQLVRLDLGGSIRDYSVDLGVAGFREIVLARPGDTVSMKVISGVADGVDEIRELHVELKPQASQ